MRQKKRLIDEWTLTAIYQGSDRILWKTNSLAHGGLLVMAFMETVGGF